MQVLMENKKKQWMYVGIIVISLGVAGWLLFGNRIISTDEIVIQHGDIFGSGGQSLETQNLLPYGTEFDVSITSDPRFLELVPAARLQVEDSELGKANPFSP